MLVPAMKIVKCTYCTLQRIRLAESHLTRTYYNYSLFVYVQLQSFQSEETDVGQTELVPVHSERFEKLDVKIDCSLIDLIEVTYKRKYKPNCAFFEFTHDSEDISEDKEVILMNKVSILLVLRADFNNRLLELTNPMKFWLSACTSIYQLMTVLFTCSLNKLSTSTRRCLKTAIVCVQLRGII